MRVPALILQVALAISLVACAPKPAPPPGPSPTPVEAAPSETAPAEPAAPAVAETGLNRSARIAELLATGRPEDAKQALTLLQEVASDRPDDARVPYNQAMAQLTIGDEGEARKRLLRATDVDPKFAPAWLSLGALAERAGELDRAQQAYEAGLRHAPQDNGLTVALASALRQRGKYKEAEALCLEVVRRDSNSIRAYDELGQVYYAKGDYALAKFAYDRAFYAVPGANDDPRMHAHVGAVHLALKDSVKARSSMERAIQMDPNLVSARLALSAFHMDNHDWNATLETLEPARQLAPRNASVLMNLGTAYRGLGRLEDAKATWEKALELDPSNLDPMLNLAILYGDALKDYPKAIETVDSYTSKGGTRRELAAEWRAALVDAQKKYERALEVKKRKEDQKRKNEERDRLAAEAKARLAQEQAEEAAAKEAAEKEAAAAPAPQPDPAAPNPQPEPVPSTPSPQPEPAPAPQPVPPPEPTPSGMGGDSSPWGGAAPSAPANPSSLGKPCSAVSSCGDAALACANDGVCRQSGAPGTFGLGIGCVSASDCAFGLSCQSNTCSEPSATPAAPSPWGGQ